MWTEHATGAVPDKRGSCGPGYRCRHGHTSANTRRPGLPKNTYVREDHLLNSLRDRLPELTALEDADLPDHLQETNLVAVCIGSTWTITDAEPPATLPIHAELGVDDNHPPHPSGSTEDRPVMG